MGSSSIAPIKYWGSLIRADKTPTPLLEQLLLGIANYINRHVAPWDIHCLTPTKLATFYRLVGGDFDPLFLDTPRSSLAFIYQSLGCFHTLQPENDPYSAPETPALTPQGFVRWQTVQVLLEPEEHAPFLQETVKRFEILNPANGEVFPHTLPRESFPAKADKEMTEWHDSVSEKLMLEAQASTLRSMPPRPPLGAGDARRAIASSPSSADTQSIEEVVQKPPMINASKYYSQPKTFLQQRGPPPTSAPSKGSERKRSPRSKHHPPPPPPYDGPWSPLRRRNSMPPAKASANSSWAQPTRHGREVSGSVPHHHHHHHEQRRPSKHSRTASSISTSSFTSESSYTDSSASLSPVLAPTHLHPIISAPPLGRRHSLAYQPTIVRNNTKPLHHPQPISGHHQRRLSGGVVLKNLTNRVNSNPNFNTPNYNPPTNINANVKSNGNGGGRYIPAPSFAPASSNLAPEQRNEGLDPNRMRRSQTVRSVGPPERERRDTIRNARSADGRRDRFLERHGSEKGMVHSVGAGTSARRNGEESRNGGNRSGERLSVSERW